MKGAKEVAAYFAANLRRVRKAADLSQEEVGFRSSLHRTEVGLLERGARVPRIDTVIKLAAALKVSPGRLLEGITWTPAQFDETRSGEFKHNPNPDPIQDHQIAEQSEGRTKAKAIDRTSTEL
jgi:transcriptional regulator with XRE-family HTH domain